MNDQRVWMKIQMRDHGTITVELWPAIAPIAIANVIRITGKGKYDGQPIERLEPDFVIQPLFQDGKDPEIDELIEPEYRTREENHRIRFRRGIVAMAGTADQASGSQYFICLKEKERLNGNFTVIGEVIDGWEEVERIERLPVLEQTDEESGHIYHIPAEAQVVESVRICYIV